MTILKNRKVFSSFSVDDVEKTKEFYSKTLGIDISESKEGLSLYPKSSNEIFIYPKTEHTPAMNDYNLTSLKVKRGRGNND